MTLRILIAGGGIGGLSAALACHAVGHDVRVYEQAPELTEVGAGIQLSPNAVKVLDALDLGKVLRDVATAPSGLEMRVGRTGRRIFKTDFDARTLQKYGAPYLHIHRADLQDLLASALTMRLPDAVHLNAAVSGVEQYTKGVELTIEGAAGAQGDILIGADGLHSQVRRSVFGKQAPRFTGAMAWRAIVPTTPELERLIPHTACVWIGQKRHAVSYYVRGHRQINFVGVVKGSDWRDEHWLDSAPAEDMHADFADWCEPIAALTSAAQEAHRWALYDRPPRHRWTQGRIALLGDACHPMLPYMAQGAAMALEDAWVLGQMLGSNLAPQKALSRYAQIRKPRTNRVQAAARSNGQLFHMGQKLAQNAVLAPLWLSGKVAPSLILKQQDWIYRHDVTT